MEHTKEPWRVELSWITGSDGKRITCPTACMSRDDDENEANERRIVACVNACAGIPTEGLENSGFSSDILLKIATLKQQCDELKKALQWYADRFSNENGKPTVAQKAIAKWEKPNAIAQGREPHNAKVSGAGTASAGLTGSAAGGLEKGEAMDMAWADKQLPPGVTRQDVCIWTQDSDGPWCGSCGVMWEFIDGGPKDNETHFCPRCGGVLLAEPFAEDETPNAPHEGRTAALSPGVPLDAVVGPLGEL